MDSPPRATSTPARPPQRDPGSPPLGGPGNLPLFLTSFVGRDEEIGLASTLLERPDLRLLTLTGPGGIGKTRLATEIAARVSEHFPDGVRFVPLAPVQEPSMVMTAVATAIGIREFDEPGIDDAVAAAVATSRLLLVLDNFEHLMPAAPALTSLLARCPHLTILVTSRSLLRVEGEHAIPVPPFRLPRSGADLSDDDWRHLPVVRLFIERAQAVNPTLAWKPDEWPLLVQICGRLDGLPLAIELAATRMRHFTLAELNDRLGNLLPILVDGSRDHPSRLQTMRNAIAWSHDLLTADLQILMRRASVFNGGFTLDAIAGVFARVEAHPGPDGIAHDRPAAARLTFLEDGLSLLVDASLLMRERAAGATRYRFLETIREYARDQLDHSGEAPLLRRAHAHHYAAYVAQREIAELIPEHIAFAAELVVEQGNIRTALSWLHDSPDRPVFETLVAALGPFWLAQSNYQEAKTWCERALAPGTTPETAATAKIMVTLGMTGVFLEENERARTQLMQAVEVCRAQGEARGVALALIGLAGVAVAHGDGERSTRLLEEARDAVAMIEESRLAGVMAGWVSINLGVAARSTGDGDLATRHVEDALERFRTEHFDAGVMMALGDLGDLARDRGDWTRALALYKDALAVGRTDQARRIVIEVIESVGIVAAHRGHMERAATLLGAAEGLRDRIGLRYRQPRNRPSLEWAVAATREGMPAQAFTDGWQDGHTLTEAAAIEAACALEVDPSGPPEFGLTARESEILRHLATGMTDPEIADTLFISVRTVEHHVANLYRKLGVRTRAAATSTAIAAGLADIAEKRT